MFADCYTFLYLVLGTLAAAKGSLHLAICSGLCLCCTTIIAHNFFHQRNNFRMYYFSFCGLSVKGWRVSHGLSHHLFPNSRQDLEITMFEPLLQWTPHPDKTWITRFLSWIYSPIVYAFFFHSQWISRLIISPEGMAELIPLTLPATMVFFGVPITSALIWWNAITIIGSFCFGVVALNAGHHHPELLHDGDEPRDRMEMDWGIYQIDAVRERAEIKTVFPLVIIMFGDHTLHHLFPTIDHVHLYKLYPVLEETCKEFGIEFRMGTIWEMICGQFRQLSRNYTTTLRNE